MIKKLPILITVVASCLVVVTVKAVLFGVSIHEKVSSYNSLAREVKYYREAEAINDYYSRYNIGTRVVVIKSALEAIDKYLPKYFPNKEFDRRDLIAIAMIESEFDQYLVGRNKEWGIFQLMPESCTWMNIKRNQFEIPINTELAIYVLSVKHKEMKDYKYTIIAYNGFVHKKRGKVSEVYWNRFIKARKAVDDILGDTNISQH